MFTKFLSSLKKIPARSTDWVNRMGPVALFGYDGGVSQSATRVLDYFYQSPRESDFYAELIFHEAAPIECPPETVAFLPVLQAGSMTMPVAKVGPSSAEWNLASTEAATDLIEKGYIPVSVGGDGSATRNMIKAYTHLFPQQNVVLLHFSAHPSVGDASSPLRALVEDDLLKGMVSIGNRCVTSADRRIRKQHKIFYMDMHAIFSKGLFCIRDIRNDFPVFISIHADILDPVYAPAVDRPVCGGLSTRELLHIIKGIRGPNVVGIDIHGYNPSLDICRADGVGMTQMSLSKVLKESILKAYTISTQTEEEGMARVKTMQRQGTLSENPYPDH